MLLPESLPPPLGQISPRLSLKCILHSTPLAVAVVAYFGLYCGIPYASGVRLIPRLLQFVSELLAALIRSLTDPCISQSEGPGEWGGRPLLPLLALRQLQKNYFRGLLEAGGRKAALSASPFVAHFLTLQRTAEERTRKQRRKSKGYEIEPCVLGPILCRT